MKVKKYLLFFLVIALLFGSLCQAIPLEQDTVTLPIQNEELVEFTLPNGLTVLMKPINNEDNEIVVRMAAKHGHSSFSAEKRVAARISTEVVWGSGVGFQNVDQIAWDLYQHCLDFYLTVDPARRSIEAEGSPEAAETLFKYFNLLFTQPRFEQAALDDVIRRYSKAGDERCYDEDSCFEKKYLLLNTNNYPSFKCLKKEYVEAVLLSDVEEAYRALFSDPSEFVCLVSGNFDPAKIKGIIEKYLGAIPVKQVKKDWKLEEPLLFPKGISVKYIKQRNRTESMTRITFPLQQEISERNFPQLELTVQSMEEKFRREFKERLGSTQGIDVAYEFPLYPMADLGWVVVQFRAQESDTPKLIGIILDNLKEIQRKGIEERDITKARFQKKRANEFWARDRDYWNVVLTNYYFWGWGLSSLISSFDEEAVQNGDVSRGVKEFISLDSYTVITGRR